MSEDNTQQAPTSVALSVLSETSSVHGTDSASPVELNELNILISASAEVEGELYRIKRHKSFGPGGLHSYFRREWALIIAALTSDILNKSLETEELPENWEGANISPIYKKALEISPQLFSLSV